MTADDTCHLVSWDASGGVARTDWLPGAVCGIEEARAVDREIRAWTPKSGSRSSSTGCGDADAVARASPAEP